MERETLKSLRAKAKELRSKVSSAPISKATPDQLRSEIQMLERAVKADEKLAMKKALKEATLVSTPQKKKTSPQVGRTAVAPAGLVRAVVQKVAPQKKNLLGDREKELLKREKELAKKEKLLMYKQQQSEDTESESDDY